ncbi:MAG: hypothetical protein C4B58_04800 [Deltaproteobacteria bacterium]|nr:MAG: hypothetical protein C4B58_04800 [Deltaproteobacteria bacterium]
MKINILTSFGEVGRALKRYLVYVIGFGWNECKIIVLGKETAYSREMLQAKLWLIDAWNYDKSPDPEGFRNAYKLAGSIKCLLLFYHVPDGFPEEGPFWCNPGSCKLGRKIREILKSPPPEKRDFEKLMERWPDLGREPEDRHHHYHHHRHTEKRGQ